MECGLDQAWRIDDERRFAIAFLNLHETGDAVVVQDATPRIS
jgi:hypothetical protein